jgi:Zn-dependent protease with chaperone function
MDFFEAQDRARRKTWKLVLLFSAAVISLILLTNIVVALVMAFFADFSHGGDLRVVLTRIPVEQWFWISAIVLIMVGGASWYKHLMLGTGGRAIAESLGGRPLLPDTRILDERRVLNVVEEMALAAGMPVPPVYVLPEPGINAFAAGRGADDAVIGITEGAMRQLSRDELQGVIGP